GYPCQQPPWGLLTAVNTRTGEIAWQVRLGEYPELSAQGAAPTGTPNIGGSAVTASGLLFIGATMDGQFRAFDAQNGQELWHSPLGGYGMAGPVTYRAGNGQQYVAIAVGGAGSLRGVHHEGGPEAGVPDRLVVFALGAKGKIAAAAAPPLAAAPAVPVAAASGSELAAGEGRALVQQVCTACHAITTVTGARFDQAGWTATVKDMVGRGAQLSDTQVAAVASYLAQHYGKGRSR
ncbi:MAG: PQQ-binding-like beta-propeller repeat protein, partial [Terriglobales bacterium]